MGPYKKPIDQSNDQKGVRDNASLKLPKQSRRPPPQMDHPKDFNPHRGPSRSFVLFCSQAYSSVYKLPNYLIGRYAFDVFKKLDLSDQIVELYRSLVDSKGAFNMNEKLIKYNPIEHKFSLVDRNLEFIDLKMTQVKPFIKEINDEYFYPGSIYQNFLKPLGEKKEEVGAKIMLQDKNSCPSISDTLESVSIKLET